MGSYREVSGYDSNVCSPVQQAQKLSLMPQGHLILRAFIPGEASDINLQKQRLLKRDVRPARGTPQSSSHMQQTAILKAPAGRLCRKVQFSRMVKRVETLRKPQTGQLSTLCKTVAWQTFCCCQSQNRQAGILNSP